MYFAKLSSNFIFGMSLLLVIILPLALPLERGCGTRVDGSDICIYCFDWIVELPDVLSKSQINITDYWDPDSSCVLVVNCSSTNPILCDDWEVNFTVDDCFFSIGYANTSLPSYYPNIFSSYGCSLSGQGLQHLKSLIQSEKWYVETYGYPSRAYIFMEPVYWTIKLKAEIHTNIEWIGSIPDIIDSVNLFLVYNKSYSEMIRKWDDESFYESYKVARYDWEMNCFVVGDFKCVSTDQSVVVPSNFECKKIYYFLPYIGVSQYIVGDSDKIRVVPDNNRYTINYTLNHGPPYYYVNFQKAKPPYTVYVVNNAQTDNSWTNFESIMFFPGPTFSFTTSSRPNRGIWRIPYPIVHMDYAEPYLLLVTDNSGTYEVYVFNFSTDKSSPEFIKVADLPSGVNYNKIFVTQDGIFYAKECTVVKTDFDGNVIWAVSPDWKNGAWFSGCPPEFDFRPSKSGKFVYLIGSYNPPSGGDSTCNGKFSIVLNGYSGKLVRVDYFGKSCGDSVSPAGRFYCSFIGCTENKCYLSCNIIFGSLYTPDLECPGESLIIELSDSRLTMVGQYQEYTKYKNGDPKLIVSTNHGPRIFSGDNKTIISLGEVMIYAKEGYNITAFNHMSNIITDDFTGSYMFRWGAGSGDRTNIRYIDNCGHTDDWKAACVDIVIPKIISATYSSYYGYFFELSSWDYSSGGSRQPYLFINTEDSGHVRYVITNVTGEYSSLGTLIRAYPISRGMVYVFKNGSEYFVMSTGAGMEYPECSIYKMDEAQFTNSGGLPYSQNVNITSFPSFLSRDVFECTPGEICSYFRGSCTYTDNAIGSVSGTGDNLSFAPVALQEATCQPVSPPPKTCSGTPDVVVSSQTTPVCGYPVNYTITCYPTNEPVTSIEVSGFDWDNCSSPVNNQCTARLNQAANKQVTVTCRFQNPACGNHTEIITLTCGTSSCNTYYLLVNTTAAYCGDSVSYELTCYPTGEPLTDIDVIGADSKDCDLNTHKCTFTKTLSGVDTVQIICNYSSQYCSDIQVTKQLTCIPKSTNIYPLFIINASCNVPCKKYYSSTHLLTCGGNTYSPLSTLECENTTTLSCTFQVLNYYNSTPQDYNITMEFGTTKQTVSGTASQCSPDTRSLSVTPSTTVGKVYVSRGPNIDWIVEIHLVSPSSGPAISTPVFTPEYPSGILFVVIFIVILKLLYKY